MLAWPLAVAASLITWPAARLWWGRDGEDKTLLTASTSPGSPGLEGDKARSCSELESGKRKVPEVTPQPPLPVWWRHTWRPTASRWTARPWRRPPTGRKTSLISLRNSSFVWLASLTDEFKLLLFTLSVSISVWRKDKFNDFLNQNGFPIIFVKNEGNLFEYSFAHSEASKNTRKSNQKYLNWYR